MPVGGFRWRAWMLPSLAVYGRGKDGSQETQRRSTFVLDPKGECCTQRKERRWHGLPVCQGGAKEMRRWSAPSTRTFLGGGARGVWE